MLIVRTTRRLLLGFVFFLDTREKFWRRNIILLLLLLLLIPVEPFHSDATSAMLIPQDINQGRLGFLGIQFIGVFNFRYTVFLCLKLGIKYSGPHDQILGIRYTVFFLILVFYKSFSIT